MDSEAKFNLFHEFIELGEKINDKDFFCSIDNLKLLHFFFNEKEIKTTRFSVNKKLYDYIHIFSGEIITHKISLFMDNLDFKFYPNEVFFTGGSLNLILDPSIDETSYLYSKSDLDICITGTIERKKELVNLILDDLHSKYTIEKIEYIGSIVNVKLKEFDRIIQLILIRSGESIIDHINKFDYDHLKNTYDGREIILTKTSYKAMIDKHSKINPSYLKKNKYSNEPRKFKNLIRNYMWFDQKYLNTPSLNPQCDIIRTFALGSSPTPKSWILSSYDKIKSDISYEGFVGFTNSPIFGY